MKKHKDYMWVPLHPPPALYEFRFSTKGITYIMLKKVQYRAFMEQVTLEFVKNSAVEDISLKVSNRCRINTA